MPLSRFYYYADFIISPALILLLAVLGLRGGSSSDFAGWAVAFACGVVFWTFAEYLVHRYIYHHVPYFKKYHDAHHDEPEALIGAPSVVSPALIFAFIFAPVWPLGLTIATGFTAGAFLGYCGYMLAHHASHQWTTKPGSYLFHLRQHHARHHYAHDLCNFGVSTAIWDHVFGTALERRRRTADR